MKKISLIIATAMVCQVFAISVDFYDELLSNDEIIFGEPPNATYTPEPSKISFSGIKFSNSPWLEIKNIGTSTAKMSDYALIGKNNSIFAIGDDSLDVGEILRICKKSNRLRQHRKIFHFIRI